MVKELNSSKFPVQEEFLKYFHNTSRSTVNEVQVSYKRLSVGRRKTAIAKVRVKNGDGKVLINSKSLLEYFPRLEDRQQVLFPLNLVGCLGKVDVSAEVSGGGVTGQQSAVKAFPFSTCSFPSRSGWCSQSRIKQSVDKFIKLFH